MRFAYVFALPLVLAACGQAPATMAATGATAQAAVAAGYDFPALTGRVVDQTHLLSVADARSIGQRLAALEQATGHQFVVVTVNSLNGYDIADYGVTLGRAWHVGRQDYNDGVLLIVAPKERKVRIEVGYWLERVLTDPEAGRVIDNEILPFFRKGDMPAGIKAGVDGVIREIGPLPGDVT